MRPKAKIKSLVGTLVKELGGRFGMLGVSLMANSTALLYKPEITGSVSYLR